MCFDDSTTTLPGQKASSAFGNKLIWTVEGNNDSFQETGWPASLACMSVPRTACETLHLKHSENVS